MNNKARNELIGVLIGLVMIVAGVGLFISKARVVSSFLESGGSWTWWKIVLVLIPLLAGIILLIVKPQLRISKIVAAAGVVVIIVAIFMDMTIYIEKGISVFEWILYGVLVFGGFLTIIISLFLNKKKNSTGV